MSILGTWKLTITSPMGTQHPTITFAEDGGAMTGIMTSPAGESGTVDALVVEGDTATWKANVVSPMGPMNLAFAASVTGDSLTGNLTTPMGPIPMTGERQT